MSLQTIQKRNWVVTYGSSKGYITFQMFRDEGSLDVDEVHSTSDGSMVFTYFHLKKRSRENGITKFMDKINQLHGIVQTEVFGYDSIGSQSQDGSLMGHIAFRMIFEHFKSGNPAFVACTDGRPGVERGSLLMQLDGLSRIKDVLSKRAKLLVPALDNIYDEFQKTKKDLEDEITKSDLLAEERSILLQRVDGLKRRISSLEIDLELEKSGRRMDRVVRDACHSIGVFPPVAPVDAQ